MSDSAQYRIPGHLIEDLLNERGWSQRILAIVLGVEDPIISKLVNGKIAVTPEMAIILGEVFGMDADVFLALQRSFDLNQARLTTRPDPDRQKRAQIFGKFPVSDMVKRGWIQVENQRDARAVEKAISGFFRVPDGEDVEILPHAAKKSNAHEEATPTQLAWLYRVRELAEEMLVPNFSTENARLCADKLKGLRQSEEDMRKIPRYLSDAGIRFLIVEALPSSKIDGACFWLDSKSPVVAMTARFDRIDNFWFVIRHELEHVIRGDGKGAVIMDTELEGEAGGIGSGIAEEERLANLAAADFCVPSDMMEKFYSRKSPYFATRDVLAFAKMIKVHPGLVAGQLRRRTQRYNIFSDLLVKVRHIIFPTSTVDGWGDIAPTGE